MGFFFVMVIILYGIIYQGISANISTVPEGKINGRGCFFLCFPMEKNLSRMGKVFSKLWNLFSKAWKINSMVWKMNSKVWKVKNIRGEAIFLVVVSYFLCGGNYCFARVAFAAMYIYHIIYE
jgi:hypothetical protein